MAPLTPTDTALLLLATCILIAETALTAPPPPRPAAIAASPALARPAAPPLLRCPSCGASAPAPARVALRGGR